ncbi:nuclease-related domain-containing protein [Thiomicrospira cyclica]|uniref:Restriction endonuclease type IV Mrr domain-containing protein n=1 Tax=Thiomicrospira cyclica (strain DSM 14477 / JCM 11371 / ALM1) TaxID=717773 RepID=F6DBT3_THICA|nr:nuclease-related domain-containing protein [Thiomicrospira cyclica]AEG31319.1 hypothetical protein Thicy_0546 [Thiomicrospira cyclica ALM1]
MLKVLFILLAFYSSQAVSFGGALVRDLGESATKSVIPFISKNTEVLLSKSEIKRLAAELKNPARPLYLNGESYAEVAAKRIGALQLSNSERERLFIEIIVLQKSNHLSKREAQELYDNLKGVEGFATALRKVAGASFNQSKGHLAEIRLANEAKKNGFNVQAIGKSFRGDPNKNVTDIDLILTKNNKTYLLEVKDYARAAPPNLDTIVRPDMETLKFFQQSLNTSDTVKIFYMTHKPSSPRYLRSIEEAARFNNVHLVFGDKGVDNVMHNIVHLK